MDQAATTTIAEVTDELVREERRLTEVEDRLRRLELERTAGDVHVAAAALHSVREALLAVSSPSP